MSEHIVAVFSSEAAATAAEQSLENAGIPRSAIRRYAASTANPTGVAPNAYGSSHTSGGGFWSWLFGEESTSETTRSAYVQDSYERSVAAGNIVIGVTVVEDSKIHDAIAALEAHNPLEIDEQSDGVAEDRTIPGVAPVTGVSTAGRDYSTSEVAQAGVTDTGVPGGHVSSPMSSAASGTTSGPAEVPVSASPAASRATAWSSTSGTVDAESGTVGVEKGEEVLPLSEEQIEIGKRTVDRGTTRIRRYVVEKPVEESVNLRTERVTVERRQPLEGTSAPGAGAFEERVVEVRETAEEPVVAKTARVVEEVVVGRETTERTETVRDTVRREQVDVSKDPR
jgi:uncharacterized protein (TIGR02271 family)